MSRHRYQEFLRSCAPSTATPPNCSVRISSSTTTQPTSTPRSRLRSNATRHNRHFTPTSASWINLVERFFGIFNYEAIRRCVFSDVDAIKAYLEHHNAEPEPLVWTARAADILEKVAKGR